MTSPAGSISVANWQVAANMCAALIPTLPASFVFPTDVRVGCVGSQSSGVGANLGGYWLHLDHIAAILDGPVVPAGTLPVDGSGRANLFRRHFLRFRPARFRERQSERDLIGLITLFNYLPCLAAFSNKAPVITVID